MSSVKPNNSGESCYSFTLKQKGSLGLKVLFIRTKIGLGTRNVAQRWRAGCSEHCLPVVTESSQTPKPLPGPLVLAE